MVQCAHQNKLLLLPVQYKLAMQGDQFIFSSSWLLSPRFELRTLAGSQLVEKSANSKIVKKLEYSSHGLIQCIPSISPFDWSDRGEAWGSWLQIACVQRREVSSGHVPLHFGRCSSPSDRFMPEPTDGRIVIVFWAEASFYRHFGATCCLHKGSGSSETSVNFCQIYRLFSSCFT